MSNNVNFTVFHNDCGSDANFSISKKIKFFRFFICRGGTDMLDEKDCGMNSDNDDEVHVSSQPNGSGTQGANKCLAMGEECDSQGTSEMPRDDDDVIEDLDDED